jgi:hypothetical protein
MAAQHNRDHRAALRDRARWRELMDRRAARASAAAAPRAGRNSGHDGPGFEIQGSPPMTRRRSSPRCRRPRNLAAEIDAIMVLLAEQRQAIDALAEQMPREARPGWLPLKVAAAKLGVSAESLRRKCVKGKQVRAEQLGARWLVDPETVTPARVEKGGTPHETPAVRRRRIAG